MSKPSDKLFVLPVSTNAYGISYYCAVRAESPADALALAKQKWPDDPFRAKLKSDSIENVELQFDKNGVSQLLSEGW